MDINCRGEGNADQDYDHQRNATQGYAKHKHDRDTVCSENHN